MGECEEKVLICQALFCTAEVTKTIWFNLECVLQCSVTLKLCAVHDAAFTLFFTLALGTTLPQP